MPLPPFANLLAFRDEDQSRLDARERLLVDAGLEVWRPHSLWLAARDSLPETGPEPPAVRDTGLAFAEGQDRALGPDPSSAARRIAEMARAHPGHLARVPGDFTFLCFHEDGSLTAARSAGGLVPLWFRACSDKAVELATRTDYLVRFGAGGGDLDPLVNAVWMGGFGAFPDDRGFLRGVRLLNRGGFLRLDAGRSPRTGMWWDPRPAAAGDLRRSPEHARRLRELVVHTLERDLDPRGGNLLTLSGGVDSCALGAVAAGVLGRPTATLSFLPSDAASRARDVHYIDALGRQFPFQPTWRDTISHERRLELLSDAPLVASQVTHPALCRLPDLRQATQIRVLFGGEWADEVCGSVKRLPDWATHTSLRSLLREPEKRPFGRRDLLRWVKWRAMPLLRRTHRYFPEELPDLVRGDVREEYRDWLDRRRRAALADSRPLRSLASLDEADGWVPMNWEATSAVGVRRSLPFCNREVLELAWSCHPADLMGPGTKKLLRDALRDDVPHENLFRADKGHGAREQNRQISWTQPLPDRLQAIVRPDWFPRPPDRVAISDALALTQLSELDRRVSVLEQACRPPTVSTA